MVSPDVLDDRQQHHGDEHDGGGHHGHGVEDTGKEVTTPRK